MSALLAFPYTSLNLYEQGCPWLFAAGVRAAIPGYQAPISAVGCYSGRLDQDLGCLGGLMTCQKWCLIYDPRAAAEYDHERLGHHGSCCLHCLWWSILKEASPPFPFASGGLQRPLLNFKGCLLKLLKVCASSKRLPSLCKGVQGDVPGGVGSWCSS